MIGLTQTTYERLCQDYLKRFDLCPLAIGPSGHIDSPTQDYPLGNPPILMKARSDAIREGIRWGEVYTFYIAPGIISWIVPVVDGEHILGGLWGGEVFADEDEAGSESAVNYLVDAGCKKAIVKAHISSLPRWSHSQVGRAAGFLFDVLYRVSTLNPIQLTRNREHAHQQRQIAENIHQQKDHGRTTYSYDEERAFFSLIRIGDKPGARKMLNRMLAGMFLNSPRVIMVQAYAIEMMGYLVRVAIEDSPMLEGMLVSHQKWIDRILKADTFETLCWELREILDDFMDAVFLQGYNRSNRKAQAVLDYLAGAYKDKVTLADIGRAVGLSSYRVAHLIRETTGKTVTQYIRQLRVREAQKLLLHTDRSYVDIAYSLGFSDHSYFIKQFREITGTTPAKYRSGSV